jgi:hypothetical protein
MWIYAVGPSLLKLVCLFACLSTCLQVSFFAGQTAWLPAASLSALFNLSESHQLVCLIQPVCQPPACLLSSASLTATSLAALFSLSANHQLVCLPPSCLIIVSLSASSHSVCLQLRVCLPLVRLLAGPFLHAAHGLLAVFRSAFRQSVCLLPIWQLPPACLFVTST